MTNTTPADWYPDPEDATQLRYWDGDAWTEHRAPAPARAAGRRADWYPDPEDATQLRYWDGEAWTEHRAPAPHTQSGIRVSGASIMSAADRNWPNTLVQGSKLYRRASLAVGRQCSNDEPWLIFVAFGSGLLAAFEDRLVIIKTGLVTGTSADAFGGERAAVFYYRDITGIELNSGMMSAVLEVLTPSYSGTANRDFWKGATSSTNADANSPFTLSNTLPLSKPEYKQMLPHVVDIRTRVAEAKQVSVSVQVQHPPVYGSAPPPSTAPGATSHAQPQLLEQLSQLADLHERGVLTDAEFTIAKSRVLGEQA